jgi:hypothetical protein
MFEPSFLDWYPRGRLAFLAGKQSKDIKSRIQFTDSIAAALLSFLKVKSELQIILDTLSISEKNGDLPSFILPSAFHISQDPQDSFSSQVAEMPRYFLSLTDYVCRFSSEFFSQFVQDPIFKKVLEENPALGCLSGSPFLIFDRAIYAIDLGEGADQLIIESFFPPAQFDTSFEMQECSKETIFTNSIGLTSALLERDGKFDIFPVVATRPFFSKYSEYNKNAINKFFQENALTLMRLLENETQILKHLSAYFVSSFESSVHLLKNREALLPVSVEGNNA